MEKRTVYRWAGTQYDEMSPIMGTMTIKSVLSQLMCLWRLPHVMGCSEMCGFLRSLTRERSGR
jgi:hypothetical protein